MVRSARDWRWSNYRATAGMVAAPGWLDTPPVSVCPVAAMEAALYPHEEPDEVRFDGKARSYISIQ